MRICVILEGCYPYVTGGVSSWIHQYIQAMPQHEFVIWAVGASSESRGKFRYRLPENVAEICEVFLDDALTARYGNRGYRFSAQEIRELETLMTCGSPDWERLFSVYQSRNVSPIAFLMSGRFLDILTALCEKEYPYMAFSDFFHTVRSMMLPLFYLMGRPVPRADLYHAAAAGYSGILARLGSDVCHVPYLITEHGLYAREREEEIIRAKWVPPAFKPFWVKFFYMLSAGAYEKASLVTSLFARARALQIEMGCAPEKCRYILNGIHYEQFAAIRPKQENGYCDIGAVLRIAPIKDVKTLIYAFAELKENVPNARLYLAGPEDDEEYAQECRELAESLRVRDLTFLGTVSIPEWMEKFDFTVLTSISEGQPLAVLEAFAAGRPCVVTDVGCCRELIGGMEGDGLGAAGFCVSPMRRHAICGAMERLCRNREERLMMGRTAKERARRYFRHETMIQNYLEAYKEVFERWRGLGSV